MPAAKSAIKSMTAYARAHFSDENYQLEWEIRTVNHRYLDISLYLPSELHAYQNDLKELIRQSLTRGKVEARLNFQSSNKAANEIALNEELIKAVFAAREKIEVLAQKPANLSAMDILNWPGVVETAKNDTDDIKTKASNLLNNTLQDLIETRLREGQRLSDLIASRCDEISTIAESVRERRKEVLAALREKIMKRITELDLSVDENRLEQELVIQAQRLDVAEELDRLSAHIEEVKLVLQRNEAVGRRLDFLMQELNREVNTLGSKSNDAKTTQAVVDLKVLIEQMREQVQNIE